VSFLSQLDAGKPAALNEQKIKPIESISISSVHFTLNLPQASQLLGMTNLRAAGSLAWADVDGQSQPAEPDGILLSYLRHFF
jgi:hypothetical protein